MTGVSQGMRTVEGCMRWSPWEAVGELPHVAVRVVPLPAEVGGACLAKRGERVWLLLDERLSRREMRTRLAHELVHLERGSTRCADAPGSWDAVVIREELRVDRIVAKRLIPEEDLRRFVEARADFGGVDAHIVADEFNTTSDVAERALRALHDQMRGAA